MSEKTPVPDGENHYPSMSRKNLQDIAAAAARMKNGTSPDAAKGGTPEAWSNVYAKAPQKRANVPPLKTGDPFANQ
jgi:hypothetical protein